MDYALSSGGGNIAASASPTTVETVQISNGVESCGNGNNGEPRGTTAYNNNCNAIDVSTTDGAMNTGARAPPREPPLAARSAPRPGQPSLGVCPACLEGWCAILPRHARQVSVEACRGSGGVLLLLVPGLSCLSC